MMDWTSTILILLPKKHPPRLIVSDRAAEAMSHNDEESPAAPVFPVFAILVQVAEEFSN